jgi:general secretion pathway protein L
MSAAETLLLFAGDALPGDDSDNRALSWVRMAGARVVAQGHDGDWRDHAARGDGTALLLIVPPSVAPVRWLRFDGLPGAQAEGAAVHAMLADRLDARDRLHAAARAGNGSAPVAAAAVDRGWLAAWMDHLAAVGLVPLAAVPMGALTTMVIGDQAATRTRDHGFAAEPALIAALGGGAAADVMPATAISAALGAAVEAPPLDLLTGAFRARAPSALTPEQRRLLLRLAAALLIVSALVPLAQMVRWSWAARDADAAVVAMARAGDVPASDAASAETAIDQRLAVRGGGPLALSVPLSALIAAMQPVPGVAIQSLAYRADGTLSVTLAAPRIDDVNAVLLALQAKGYRVTAQPMTGADGLQKGSVTIRAVP